MPKVITENEIEEISLEYFKRLGYGIIHAPDISPDGTHPERQYTEVVLINRLRDAIDKLNPTIPNEVREEALKKVLRTSSPNLLINNEIFHRYLTEGVDVEVRRDDGIRGDKVYLVDFETPENNEFFALNQFTIIENNNNRRPDIILFVNGLPLVLIELKNAADENATVYSAFKQLQTYKAQIPSLFVYNALLIVSDGWDARCGTLTSPFSRFMAWKTEDGVNLADDSALQMETMTNGMLRKDILLDLIKHFIVFEKREEKTAKKIAAYHQYYAVNKALNKTIKASALSGDRRAGVVWHTQGSGKSLSMVFYSGKVVLQLDNPTIVVITDRNDLDTSFLKPLTLADNFCDNNRNKPMTVKIYGNF